MQQLPDLKKRKMRLLIIAAILLVGVSAVLAGCANQIPAAQAEIGNGIILEPGQKAIYTDESLKIRFVEVVNDSRCPTGVQCIWAGEVSAKIEIDYQDQQKSMVLTQSGSSDAQTQFLDYQIAFDIQPYPEAQKPIKAQDYSLHLTVTKEAELTGGVLATFQVLEERYSIFITNPETIEQVYAVQRGESNANIPIGRVIRGAVSYNAPWSWHIDSEEISMAEVTIELSDGLPSYLEDDLDYWADTVKYFSPWSAELIEIKDYR